MKLSLLLFLVCMHLPSASASLRVLTLNTWLLSVLGQDIGQDISFRVQAIPQRIADLQPDIIALQEVWSTKTKRKFAHDFEQLGYPYSYYHGQLLSSGDGLMIISRFPILEAYSGPVYLIPTKLNEIFARKRGLRAVIQLPSGEKLDFYTTHMGAIDFSKRTGTYISLQKKRQNHQYRIFKNWLMATHHNPRLVVAGDFNANYLKLKGGVFIPEYDPNYLHLLQSVCGSDDLLNTFLFANNMDEHSPMSPTYALSNPYVANGRFAENPEEVEDYIFSCGFKPSEIQSSQLVFNQQDSIISDHYGIVTDFSF